VLEPIGAPRRQSPARARASRAANERINAYLVSIPTSTPLTAVSLVVPSAETLDIARLKTALPSGRDQLSAHFLAFGMIVGENEHGTLREMVRAPKDLETATPRDHWR
jgi:hypothetical protein